MKYILIIILLLSTINVYGEKTKEVIGDVVRITETRDPVIKEYNKDERLIDINNIISALETELQEAKDERDLILGIQK